jgi:hypothetical protein
MNQALYAHMNNKRKMKKKKQTHFHSPKGRTVRGEAEDSTGLRPVGDRTSHGKMQERAFLGREIRGAKALEQQTVWREQQEPCGMASCQRKPWKAEPMATT